MSKTLATAVHITDESGIVHSFLPGTKPPKWAREKITNPKAWAEESSDETVEEPAEQPDAGEEPSGSIPPKSGRGSSAEAWRAYAESNDFDVDDDVSRDDIIAALAANGIPTE